MWTAFRRAGLFSLRVRAVASDRFFSVWSVRASSDNMIVDLNFFRLFPHRGLTIKTHTGANIGAVLLL